MTNWSSASHISGDVLVKSNFSMIFLISPYLAFYFSHYFSFSLSAPAQLQSASLSSIPGTNRRQGAEKGGWGSDEVESCIWFYVSLFWWLYSFMMFLVDLA